MMSVARYAECNFYDESEVVYTASILSKEKVALFNHSKGNNEQSPALRVHTCNDCRSTEVRDYDLCCRACVPSTGAPDPVFRRSSQAKICR